jgi:hypothetical protein
MVGIGAKIDSISHTLQPPPHPPTILAITYHEIEERIDNTIRYAEDFPNPRIAKVTRTFYSVEKAMRQACVPHVSTLLGCPCPDTNGLATC